MRHIHSLLTLLTASLLLAACGSSDPGTAPVTDAVEQTAPSLIEKSWRNTKEILSLTWISKLLSAKLFDQLLFPREIDLKQDLTGLPV